MELQQAKDRVAKSMGYPNWTEFFNWIARDGETPVVVAQQIESAMEEVIHIIRYGNAIPPAPIEFISNRNKK